MNSKSLRLMVVIGLAIGLLAVPVLYLGGGFTAQSVPSVRAAGTITVNTANDEYDLTPNSTCALREAIEAINTQTDFGGCTYGGADTIELEADSYNLTIGPAASYDNSAGDLYINKSMIIQGKGSTETIIRQTVSDSRVLYISVGDSSGVYVTLQGLTVEGGNYSSSGGGMYVSITDWSDPDDSLFSLSDVVVKDNQSGGSGGGIYFDLVSTAVFTDVTLENNRATNNGGGLGVGYGSQVELDRVTVYSNTAGFGGGIYYQNQYVTTRMELANVTIFSNTAQTTGGGLYLDYYYGITVNLTANNVTLAYNRAITGGNIYNNQSNLEIANTIIAYGAPDNCAGNPTANVTSGGYNLDSGASCGLSSTGDLSSTAPQLATSLSDEGGKTKLLVLQKSSPAINAGNPAPPGSGSGACETTDQRQVSRPQGSACDMGAYELTYYSHYLPVLLKN